MQDDSRQGAFLFIHLALEGTILFTWHKDVVSLAPLIYRTNFFYRFAEVGCLSPSTFRQRNNASSHHDNDDDSGKRLHRGEGPVPVVPKL
jgi:hypothetical protein